MDGFLNILKPPGMSSGAVVAVVKRLLGEKVGHAGTLDPEAAGVLPLMVGRATRLLDYFSDKEKEYVAQIAFGCATDTQDAQGTVTETGDALPERAQIETVLSSFTGEIMQCPPAYSAIKLDGKPLYALARQGEFVQTMPRPVMIHEITLGAQAGEGVYVLTVRCGKGTYIRTLCHDLGQALRCPAHMRFLLRTQSGPFRIKNANTLEELTEAVRNGEVQKMLLPMDYPLIQLRGIDIPPRLWKQAVNGVHLSARLFPLEENEQARMYANHELIGIAKRQKQEIVFSVLLTGAKDFFERCRAE